VKVCRHRDANPVEPTGDLVAAATELAARVEDGEHRGHGRQVLAGSRVGGDTAAVVLDAYATVGQQGDHDAVAVAGQRLVDGVVDDLPDQVVETPLAGGADVHARTLADRLESLEHGDRRRVVLDAVGRLWRCGGTGRLGGDLLGSLVAHTHLFVGGSRHRDRWGAQPCSHGTGRVR
jgi:hypothetical protein